MIIPFHKTVGNGARQMSWINSSHYREIVITKAGACRLSDSLGTPSSVGPEEARQIEAALETICPARATKGSRQAGSGDLFTFEATNGDRVWINAAHWSKISMSPAGQVILYPVGAGARRILAPADGKDFGEQILKRYPMPRTTEGAR